MENRILSIGGSGVRFPAYLGAYSILKQFYTFDEFIGVSGGAITSALLATGRTFDDVVEVVMELNFRSFLKKSWGWPVWGKCRYRAKPIVECMDEIFLKKRMGDLVYPLTVIAYDLASQTEVHFSSAETPEVSVAFAVKSSMCIPFVFEAEAWNGYSYLVDGGISNNLGVDLTRGRKFLGMKTQSPEQETLYEGSFMHTVKNTDMLVGALMSALDKEHMDDVDALDNMLFIPCSVGSLKFDIDEGEKSRLFVEGVQAATKFLEKKAKSSVSVKDKTNIF